jgi:Tol biopolymer transport system component
VFYLDKPSPDAPTGFWGVDTTGVGTTGVGTTGVGPALFTDRIGVYSPDMSLLAYPQNDQTIVERRSDGQRWTIPSEGRAISFSPDGSMVAWTAGDPGPPFDTPLRRVWLSAFDGSQPREVAQVTGGGFSGWFPDGRILVSGRLDPADPVPGLWAVSLQDGSYTRLASGERLRGITISPGGSWLVYQRVFDPDPAQNGIWLVNTNTGETRRLDLFGGYRWQDDGRLLIIPLDTTQPNHRLWQVEAATGNVTALTDPAILPFKVANGDWSVSPDGKKVAFVSAGDYNIWLIDLEP